MKVIALGVLFCLASAHTSYHPPSADDNEYPPRAYSFSWEVNDAPSDNNFAHSESSDGHSISGSYRVALPDGRTQIVTYQDDNDGYVAEVKYEAEAPAYSALPYQAPGPSASVAPTPATAYSGPAGPTYPGPTTRQYETATPVYQRTIPLFRIPAPAYTAPASKAPTATYIDAIVPAYKPTVLAVTYETRSAPVSKATGYTVPLYRPPVTASPVDTPSPTADTPIDRSPANRTPAFDRPRSKRATN